MKCEKRVTDKQSMTGRTHQCKNNAKPGLVVDGKHYCGQHDPAVTATRKAARQRFMDEQSSKRRRALEDQKIGAAVRELFRWDYPLEQILAWCDDPTGNDYLRSEWRGGKT